MRIWRKGMKLADRLRPYVQPIEPAEPMVSADPIRMFLFRWMIETGDPVEIVAKGFNVTTDEIQQMVAGYVPVLSASCYKEWEKRLFLAKTDSEASLI